MLYAERSENLSSPPRLQDAPTTATPQYPPGCLRRDVLSVRNRIKNRKENNLHSSVKGNQFIRGGVGLRGHLGVERLEDNEMRVNAAVLLYGASPLPSMTAHTQ